MVVKHYHCLVKYVKHVWCIIALLPLVLHGNVLKVSNRVETRVAEETAHVGILAANLNVIDKLVYGLSRSVVFVHLALHATAVGHGYGCHPMGYGHAGHGIYTDKRA